MSEATQTYEEWVKSIYQPQPQEPQVSETTEELPAVSKLREAFDTARNAIIDGSELAKQVAELNTSVVALRTEVVSLQRDLEYVRSRNRELDEQVTNVRQARDNALADVSSLQAKLYDVDSRRTQAESRVQDQVESINQLRQQIESMSKERDDAMGMALEYESKLKEAQAKLAKVEAVFMVDKQPSEAKPVPHYLVQPRDEETKQFRSFDEPKPYDSGSQGSF